MITPDSNFNIKLRIGGTVNSISIKREEEKLYRDAERLVNDRLNHYVQTYPKQTREEHLTMLVLDIALAWQRNKDRNDTEPFKQTLNTLLNEIESHL